MTTLGDDLLTVFDRACHEQDWEIAEHIFRALELLSLREGSEEKVESAYLELVRTLGRRPCH